MEIVLSMNTENCFKLEYRKLQQKNRVNNILFTLFEEVLNVNKQFKILNS